MNAVDQTCLIVDDDALVADHLRRMVEDAGLMVCGVVQDGESAIETAINLQPDVILMDIRLGGDLDGIDAAVQIVRRARSRIVFITAYNDALTLERMQSQGPGGILTKPIDPQVLKTTLRR